MKKLLIALFCAAVVIGFVLSGVGLAEGSFQVLGSSANIVSYGSGSFDPGQRDLIIIDPVWRGTTDQSIVVINSTGFGSPVGDTAGAQHVYVLAGAYGVSRKEIVIRRVGAITSGLYIRYYIISSNLP